MPADAPPFMVSRARPATQLPTNHCRLSTSRLKPMQAPADINEARQPVRIRAQRVPMASDRIRVWHRATKRVMPIVPNVDPLHDSKGSPWPGIKMEHFQVENPCTPEVSTSSFLSALCLSTHNRSSVGSPSNWVIVKPEEMMVVGPSNIPAKEFLGNVEFLVLEIAPMYLTWAAEGLVTGNQFDPSACWRFRDDQLRHIVLAMHHELLAGFPSGRLFGEQMGLSFATALLTKVFTTAPRTGGYRGGLSPAKLRLAKTFVNDNLASSLSLTDLASLVEMGPCHFARAFKESTGLSPHQYVLRRRIDRAIEMLKDERSSLAGIAYDLGFSSQGHFTTVFRKFTGTQPTNYREHLLSFKQMSTWRDSQFGAGEVPCSIGLGDQPAGEGRCHNRTIRA
jgi:AraC family transcriptional regulator